MSINVKIGSAPQPVIQDTTIGVSINTTPKVGVIINNQDIISSSSTHSNSTIISNKYKVNCRI